MISFTGFDKMSENTNEIFLSFPLLPSIHFLYLFPFSLLFYLLSRHMAWHTVRVLERVNILGLFGEFLLFPIIPHRVQAGPLHRGPPSKDEALCSCDWSPRYSLLPVPASAPDMNMPQERMEILVSTGDSGCLFNYLKLDWSFKTRFDFLNSVDFFKLDFFLLDWVFFKLDCFFNSIVFYSIDFF